LEISLEGVLIVNVEIRTFRDNELITGISILAVLKHSKELEYSKCILIEPILSYSRVLKALRRANSCIKSIEDLILRENIAFADFDSRFQDCLILSLNSLLLFREMGLISLNDGKAFYLGEKFDFYNSGLGEKANERISVAKRLSEIMMKGDASDLYLSLRIEL